MTGVEPDGYWPVQAANYDSFAGFANTSQADWEAQLFGATAQHFTPWEGICALMMQVPFLGDLIEMGGGPEGGIWGPIGAIFDGIVYMAESLCALFLGAPSPGDTTPTTMLDGIAGLFGSLLDNPFIAGLVTLAEDTGNLLNDIIMSALGLIADICALFTGQPGSDTTPQTITDGITGVFDVVRGSDFLTGLIEMATTTGSMVLELIDGFVNMLDALWNALVVPFLEIFEAATPNGLLGFVDDIVGKFLDFLIPIIGFTTDVISSFFQIIIDVVELFGNPFGIGHGNPSLGGLSSIPILGPIHEFVQDLVDSIIHAISGIPIVGGTIAQVLAQLAGLVGFTVDTDTLANDTAGNLGSLLWSLLHAPLDVIGNIANLIVDAIGGTVSSLVDGLFAGFAPLNTAAGAAGGSGGGATATAGGGGGYNPPTVAATISSGGAGQGGGLYSTVQTANYNNYQLAATVNANAGQGGGLSAPQPSWGWW